MAIDLFEERCAEVGRHTSNVTDYTERTSLLVKGKTRMNLSIKRAGGSTLA